MRENPHAISQSNVQAVCALRHAWLKLATMQALAEEFLAAIAASRDPCYACRVR
jgi:hypothetical protein